MKTKTLLCAVSGIVLLAFGVVSCASHAQEEAKLEAEAKVSRADAENLALAKVSGGTIKEGEIERENGKLIWSFDVATPGTTDISEVQIDALNGEVVAIEKETPAQHAKEGKNEKD